MGELRQLAFCGFQVGKLRDIQLGRKNILAKLRGQFNRRRFDSLSLGRLYNDLNGDFV